MPRVDAVSASHPETTSRCTARTDDPRPQQASTNAAPPTRTTNPAYARSRPKPYSRPTRPSSGAWPETDTVVSEGAPTEKLKAPATGWLSADTTWYVTVYVPSGSPLCRRTVYVVPSGLSGSPRSTRLPFGSSTRRASSLIATGSEKVSDTWAGALSTTVPCWGSLPVSAACAETGAAPASSAPVTASNSSTRIRTRGAMVWVTGVSPSVSVLRRVGGGLHRKLDRDGVGLGEPEFHGVLLAFLRLPLQLLEHQVVAAALQDEAAVRRDVEAVHLPHGPVDGLVHGHRTGDVTVHGRQPVGRAALVGDDEEPGRHVRHGLRHVRGADGQVVRAAGVLPAGVGAAAAGQDQRSRDGEGRARDTPHGASPLMISGRSWV